MRKKVTEGKHTHGKVYGYIVVRIGPGHCELRIHEPEAAVVRQIFREFASGRGARTIAEALNRARVPKPRAQQGRADGWSVSTIRAVLWRPLYRGEVVYGRTSKAYNRELKRAYRGTTREKGQIPMPEDTWVVVPAEHLRIIEPDLAARVDARLDDRRTRYLAAVARNNGLSPHKAHGKYLLSGGMLICPNCGGHFEARKNPWTPSKKTAALLPPESRVGHPAQVYICSTRRRKPGVCTNTLALPIDKADHDVLSVLEHTVFHPHFMAELLRLVDNAPDDTTWLTAQRDELKTEVQRLVASIVAGVPPDTVAPVIREKEDEIRRLETKLRAPRVPRLGQDKLRAALEQRAAEWKAELRATPDIARIVLRRLVGPITLWDDADRPDFCRWAAEPTTELLDGLAPTLHVASPRGTAEICIPELPEIRIVAYAA